MTPERWRQVKELFHSALALEPHERRAFLQTACVGRDSLRREVESLLKAHELTGSFIDAPAYLAAAEMLSDEVEQLRAGSSFACYEVIRALGRGGMGEVYLAEDKRLGRMVALKLLPTQVTQHGEHLRRFEREARAASSLNHPNILTIYEIGEADGKHFIAAEFVEGKTLRERIRRCPIRLEEALEVGIQIASALSAAHERGIIHRDIKPENIVVRDDGLVKVLDFGLAKLDGREDTDSEATTRPVFKTASGVIMGTVAYMSPEQARGLALDARTDIWSLGCVLYEMVTGRQPFAGPTGGDTIVNILEREPPSVTEALPQASQELQRILGKALSKNIEERYQTARDLASELKNLKRQFEPARPGSGTSASSFLSAQGWRAGVVFGALALLVILLAVIGIDRFSKRKAATNRQPQAPAPTVILKTTQLTTWPGLDLYPALAPDGNSIAYSSDHTGAFEIYVKQLAPGARELQLTSDGQQNFHPTWSPDGKMIAYSSKGRGGIWVMPSSGGSAKQLTDFGGRPAWSPVGSLIAFQSPPTIGVEASTTGVVGPPTTLWIVPSQGGEARPLTRVGSPPGGHGNPSWSPDGKRVVFIVSDSSSRIDIWNISVDGTGLTRVTDGSRSWLYDPIYAPDGEHIYYGGVSETGGFSLYKLRVSPVNGEAMGPPVEIAGSVLARFKHLTISADGKRLAYSAPMSRGNVSSVTLSPVSNETLGAPRVLTQDSSYRKIQPTWSPDGRKIAYVEVRGGVNQDIWVMDGDGRNQTQLTTDPGIDWAPSWFPDNDRIAFKSARQEKNMLWTVSLKSGRETPLIEPLIDLGFPKVSPDGKLIVFNSIKSGPLNLWVIPVEGGEPKQLTFDKDLAGFACWSPDGRYLAFEIKRGDDTHIAIMPSSGGTPTQLTAARGQSFTGSFSPDGERIAFAAERDGIWNIYWVSRDGKTQKQLTSYDKLNAYVRYPDWSKDGKQIVYEYSESAGNIWMMELK